MNHYESDFLELTYDAALKSYHRKKSLKIFLSTCGIKDTFLTSWTATETKREFLDRTFDKVRAHEQGPAVFTRMAEKLAQKVDFPDLANWEDSEKKIRDARNATQKLAAYLERRAVNKRDQERSQVERERVAKLRQEISMRQRTLSSLETRLEQLSRTLGTQKAGYDFQEWFYDLADFFEIPNRRPYVSGGRQIDGSLTVDGTPYLVELKFTKEQAAAPDIDVFFRKVETRADNTMGIFISISGYSGTAIAEASKAKTVVLLLDHSHLFIALRDMMSLPEVISRVRRHAAQTGNAFLPTNEFGG